MTDSYIPQRFGEKLRELRKAHGLTVVDIAAQLGYASNGYISEIERNKKQPTVEFVLKVARLFDVSTDVLLKDELELDSAEDT